MAAQEALQKLWLEGWDDRLCGREQAKAWALREVWKESHDSTYGLNAFVAQRVRKTKNGKPKGDHPTAEAISELFQKIDSDPQWFPGKQSDNKRGPQRILVGPKKAGIVAAAKRLKTEEGEVTYGAVVAACPKATLNPDTQEPVSKQLVYTVFRECCFDDDPAYTWEHRARLSKSALDETQIKRRWDFAKHMLTLTHTPQWYYTNLVWCDLCSSLLPKTKAKALHMTLARKGKKGWMSDGSQQSSQNLRGKSRVTKMSGSDTVKVWFVPVLARGKFDIEFMPDLENPGDTEEGAEAMVAKVKVALNARFKKDPAPKILFTDRGNGFYESGSGVITPTYKKALKEHGLRAFWGQDASIQPGQLQEVMLHETAMAWVRERLSKTQPKNKWEETVEMYHARLKDVASYINAQYDVEGLCWELPGRIDDLNARKGDRLSK